jgi:hypothetical protein
LPERFDAKEGECVEVTACHDDYSIWFGTSMGVSRVGGENADAAEVVVMPEAGGSASDAAAVAATTAASAAVAVVTEVGGASGAVVERPVCRCGIHVLWNPNRIWALSDCDRNTTYYNVVAHALTGTRTADSAGGTDLTGLDQPTLCVTVGDGGYLALIAGGILKAAAAAAAAACGGGGVVGEGAGAVSKVVAVEASPLSKRTVRKLLAKNKLTQLVTLLDSTDDIAGIAGFGTIAALVAEPYFYSALLPWHGLQFWYTKEKLGPLLAPNAVVVPSRGCLKGQLVRFLHFQKTQERVGVKCGIDLSAYDQAVQGHYEADAPCSVWEYEHVVKSEPFTMLDFDFMSSVADVTATALPAVTGEEGVGGGVNGVLTWMEYQLMPGIVESGAPRRAEGGSGGGQRCRPHHCRQSVRLLDPNKHTGDSLTIVSKFDAATGEVHFVVEAV